MRIGTPLALIIGMESGVDSVLGPIIEKARKDERLPESGLPTLGAMIEAYVGHVLTVTAHNIAQSARILGIARSTLYHRMRNS